MKEHLRLLVICVVTAFGLCARAEPEATKHTGSAEYVQQAIDAALANVFNVSDRRSHVLRRNAFARGTARTVGTNKIKSLSVDELPKDKPASLVEVSKVTVSDAKEEALSVEVVLTTWSESADRDLIPTPIFYTYDFGIVGGDLKLAQMSQSKGTYRRGLKK